MKKLPQTHLMVRFATLAALLLTLLIPLPASAQQKKEAPPKPEDPGFPAYVLDRVPFNSPKQKEKRDMTTDEQKTQPQEPLFLHISPARLIILSIVSMSLYEAYWIYKNWRYIKERDGLKIQPFWRGVFGIFFCHSLLRRIHEDGEARAVEAPSFSPGGLATGWVILLIIGNIVGRAPGVAASIISAFIPSFLCLVPVQKYINSVTQKRNPGQPYYGWSSGHIVCLVSGIIIWALLLVGLGAEM